MRFGRSPSVGGGEIGAVGDAEFARIHGTNSQQAVLERLNNVDGIFSSEVGVQINVPLVQIFTDSGAASYPFSDTVAAGDRVRLATPWLPRKIKGK